MVPRLEVKSRHYTGNYLVGPGYIAYKGAYHGILMGRTREYVEALGIKLSNYLGPKF